MVGRSEEWLVEKKDALHLESVYKGFRQSSMSSSGRIPEITSASIPKLEIPRDSFADVTSSRDARLATCTTTRVIYCWCLTHFAAILGLVGLRRRFGRTWRIHSAPVTRSFSGSGLQA